MSADTCAYPCSPHCEGYLREQRVVAELDALRAALRSWKCGACGGLGKYLNRNASQRGIGEWGECKVCEGDGLNPIASKALAGGS